MGNRKLNQVVAIEKGTKARVGAAVTAQLRLSEKPSLFSGHSKRYVPLNDAGERYPDDNQRVQASAAGVLKECAKQYTELFDVTASKESANCSARADVIVDGQVLVKQAPVTLLLFLEKRMTDVRSVLTALPTLDEGFDWVLDENTGSYRTRDAQVTHRTKKVTKVLTLAQATDKHPAQAQTYTEDEVVGHWSTVLQSGALPVPRKAELLDRVERVLRAVKFAREEANSIEAPELRLGDAVFGYLFLGK